MKNIIKTLSANEGQALIVILVTATVAIIIFTTSVYLSIHQLKTSARNQLAQKVFYAAEAGAEEALMRMIRKDPAQITTICPSTSENTTIDSVSVTISYTPLFGGCVVYSIAQKDYIIKKIQVFANLAKYNTDKVFETGSWGEIPP